MCNLLRILTYKDSCFSHHSHFICIIDYFVSIVFHYNQNKPMVGVSLNNPNKPDDKEQLVEAENTDVLVTVLVSLMFIF